MHTKLARAFDAYLIGTSVSRLPNWHKHLTDYDWQITITDYAYRLRLQNTITYYDYRLLLQITITDYDYRLRLQITITDYNYRLRLQITITITITYYDYKVNFISVKNLWMKTRLISLVSKPLDSNKGPKLSHIPGAAFSALRYFF